MLSTAGDSATVTCAVDDGGARVLTCEVEKLPLTGPAAWAAAATLSSGTGVVPGLTARTPSAKLERNRF